MAIATVSLFLDKRASKDGKGLIKWLVCHERKQRLFTTGQKATPEDWDFLQVHKGDKVLDKRIKDEDKRGLWQKIHGETYQAADGVHDGYLKRAQNIIDELGHRFTFDAFADAIANYGKQTEAPTEQTDVLAALHAKADNMVKDGRLGNAVNYRLAAKSLGRFVEGFGDEERHEFLNIPVPRRKSSIPLPPVVLRFEHLTPDLLTTYEQWMLHCGKGPQPKAKQAKAAAGASLTTVGIYLRHLRAVVNDAIEAGVLSRDAYPFGRNRYVIPAGTNTKKALPKASIEQVKAYQPLPGTMEQRSHDLWLFSYFCNGANVTDICHLTWSRVDFKEGKLTFIRQKTSRSRKQMQAPIVVYLRPETLAILERWGTTDRRPTRYVFPFLTSEMDASQRKQAVHQTVKMTNKWMGKIAGALGIDADVNTYAARHSFATSLLKSKAPLAFISKSLGHTNLKTTESYLGSFDDEEAKAFLSTL